MRLINKTVVVAFALICSVASFSQITLDSIYNKGKFVIGTTGTQPPYSMLQKDGSTVIGYEIDIAQNLADALGVELEVKVMTFEELLPAVNSGKIDAAMSGITMTVSRNTGVVFVGPYSFTGKSLIVTKKTLKKINKTNQENIGELKVSALKGSTSETFVKEEFEGAQETFVGTLDEGIKAVQDGTTDAMVADYPTCVIAALKDEDRNLRYLEDPITSEPIGMALGTTDIRLINLVQNYIYFLDYSGELDDLEYKWYDEGAWLDSVK